MGSGYALLAIGFTLIFGVLRRLNLSYGPSIMVGVFFGTFLFIQFQAGWYAVLVGTVLGAALAGAYVERLCFWAIKKGAAVASIVSSFAVWMQLEEGVTIAFPDRTYEFPALGDFELLELAAVGPPGALNHLAHRGAPRLRLTSLLFRTASGSRWRGVEDPTLRFHGVNTGRVIFLAFILASAIGGIAGYFIMATEEVITPKFGLQATFKGLIAMMLGGMGSVPGAIAGGLLLGVVEKQAEWYAGAVWRDIAAFCCCSCSYRPAGDCWRSHTAASETGRPPAGLGAGV